jgi:hypothetical protein
LLFVLVLAVGTATPALADTTYVELGSPTALNAVPFWGQTYDGFRCQWLYYQSEISRAGNIVAIGLFSGATPPVEYYHVAVIMCHTGVDDLEAEFNANYDGNSPEKVFEADTLLVGTGQSRTWYYFPSAFEYNNQDNLILEITWRGDAGVNVPFYRNPLGHSYRRLFAYNDTSSFGFRDTVNGHYVRLGFVPTAVAEPSTVPVVRLEPTLAHDMLWLNGSTPAALVDIAGRPAAHLVPGANELHHLAPGVYFVRREGIHRPRRVIIAD